jgi:hypothetical protein
MHSKNKKRYPSNVLTSLLNLFIIVPEVFSSKYVIFVLTQDLTMWLCMRCEIEMKILLLRSLPIELLKIATSINTPSIFRKLLSSVYSEKWFVSVRPK